MNTNEQFIDRESKSEQNSAVNSQLTNFGEAGAREAWDRPANGAFSKIDPGTPWQHLIDGDQFRTVQGTTEILLTNGDLFAVHAEQNFSHPELSNQAKFVSHNGSEVVTSLADQPSIAKHGAYDNVWSAKDGSVVIDEKGPLGKYIDKMVTLKNGADGLSITTEVQLNEYRTIHVSKDGAKIQISGSSANNREPFEEQISNPISTRRRF